MITLNGNLVVVGVILALIIYTNYMPIFNDKIKKVTEQMVGVTIFNNEETVNNVHNNKCSRDCCKHSQWPTPFRAKSEEDNNVSSNLMCNGGNGGGCVCMNKDDVAYLSERGGNGATCSN